MLGKKIKFHRLRLRMSQQELSAALGVSQAAIAYYESDKNQPSHEVLIKLSQTFGVSIDELFDYNVNAASVWGDFIELKDDQKQIIYTLINSFKRLNQDEK